MGTGHRLLAVAATCGMAVLGGVGVDIWLRGERASPPATTAAQFVAAWPAATSAQHVAATSPPVRPGLGAADPGPQVSSAAAPTMKMPPSSSDKGVFRPATVALGDAGQGVGPGGEYNVPFYVYSGPEFDWLSCTDEDYSVDVHKLFKHGNDAWFAEQVRHHPWRVDDPEQALLFVVPVLVGWSVRRKRCGKQRSWNKLRDAARTIFKLPYWNRTKGSDHLALTTDFRVFNAAMAKGIKRLFPGFIWGLQLNSAKRHGRLLDASCSFAVPMNSMLPATIGPAEATALREQPLEQFWARAHPFYFKGQVDARKNYQRRAMMGRAAAAVAAKTPLLTAGGMYVATHYENPAPSHRLPGMPNCSCPQEHGRVTVPGPGDTCINCVEPLPKWVASQATRSLGVRDRLSRSNAYASDMPEARLALHISGDLPSSNRFYDILKVGSIPAVLARDIERTLPFADVVPWSDLMVRFQDPISAQSFRSALKHVVPSTDAAAAAGVLKMRRLIAKHAPDALWDAAGSRVTTNVLLYAARHCLGRNLPYPPANHSKVQPQKDEMPYQPIGRFGGATKPAFMDLIDPAFSKITREQLEPWAG